MTAFELVRHLEIDKTFQGINLTEFLCFNDDDLRSDQMIDTFIQSKHFTVDSLRNTVKTDTQTREFLKQAFEIPLIAANDFKIFTKQELAKFLDDVSHEGDWGDNDVQDFLLLKDKFIELTDDARVDKFYLISKDWFDATDNRVRHPEYEVYIYYFLILWLDSTKHTLTVAEWTYD